MRNDELFEFLSEIQRKLNHSISIELGKVILVAQVFSFHFENGNY